MAKLIAAGFLLLSFPVYWFSVPAILKSWIDRTFPSSLCFGGRRTYDRGGLKGRRKGKAGVCASSGVPLAGGTIRNRKNGRGIDGDRERGHGSAAARNRS